ncbi:ATP-binding protein (plasmid) [Sinorhizobium meliloti]|uniref:sensor histidine kinase n=1 Tax=Rhizobium meliloti TaxID=382 RepID=UPI002D7699FE|nr:ATP-binding protein [Sinorhizobium meliloti]WRQ72063.1 ATP-binding protein [Sinorhizobium meliloti]
MRLALTGLTLARRYLWGSLVAALIPLLIVAFLYDRYSVDLLDNLVRNRIDNQLESIAAKSENFIAVQTGRLESIVDLPDTTALFKQGVPAQITDQLLDLLLLEMESGDIYAVEFMDIDGNVIQTIPPTRQRARPYDYTTLPFVPHGKAEIIGPEPPRSGRPGWFLIRMPVILNQEIVGFVSLRMRLSSLTEQVAGLLKPDLYEPRVVVFDRINLTAVGTAAEPGTAIARSRHIMPGWRIDLVEDGDLFSEPRTQVRYQLLLIAAISAISVTVLFIRMSQRVTRYLLPLSEGARAISNGDFTNPVPEDGPGEMGALAQAFNRMRVQLERMISSRVDMERRAALGNIAAGIAHEVRNPLTTVAATLYGLKQGERDSERREMYNIVSEEIIRVDQTIAEFLKYAKPNEAVIEIVQLRHIFKSTKTLLSAAAHEKGGEISLIGDSSIELLIDPAHLRQILLNLTLNAIQAIAPSGHVSLRAHRPGKVVEISITDDGSGMDEESVGKALRPFFTTRPGGTGLGLPITNQLVEANGGTMIIESSCGHGTVITLRFPTDFDRSNQS